MICVLSDLEDSENSRDERRLCKSRYAMRDGTLPVSKHDKRMNQGWMREFFRRNPKRYTDLRWEPCTYTHPAPWVPHTSSILGLFRGATFNPRLVPWVPHTSSILGLSRGATFNPRLVHWVPHTSSILGLFRGATFNPRLVPWVPHTSSILGLFRNALLCYHAPLRGSPIQHALFCSHQAGVCCLSSPV